MKNLRFYADFGSAIEKQKAFKSRAKAPNVLAVLVDDKGHARAYGSPPRVDIIAAVFFHANSPVSTSSASLDYLRESCKRIGEAEARLIHPKLFAWLDQVEPSTAQEGGES